MTSPKPTSSPTASPSSSRAASSSRAPRSSCPNGSPAMTWSDGSGMGTNSRNHPRLHRFRPRAVTRRRGVSDPAGGAPGVPGRHSPRPGPGSRAPHDRSGGRGMTTTTAAVMRSGIARGLIEFRQAFSGVELIGQLFWPLVTLGAIYFFRDRSINAGGVTLGTMMFPGVLGMFVAFGMVLVIQPLAADREDGTLLRAKATPGAIPSYLVAKLVNVSLTIVVYLLMVAVPGSFLIDGLETANLRAWLTLAWVLVLGMAATQLLGAALGSMVSSPRAASYIALAVMALTAVSGIFYPLTAMPVWLQWVGQGSPIYWLGLGMRSGLLPDAAAASEVAGSWRTWESVGALSAWTTLGLAIAPLLLRRMARRESGSRVADRRD